MSHKAINWAIEQTPKTATEKMVLMVLADRHNNADGRCFPSMIDISERAVCGRRTAIRAIESLANQGLITVKKTKGKVTFYTLNMCHFDTGANGTLVPERHLTGANLSTTGANLSTTGATVAPEPVRTSKNQEITKKSAPKVAYPVWLNLDLWKLWKETRQTGKTKYTAHAEKLGLSKLQSLAPNGLNHEAIINQSIERGWKTFFPIKEDQHDGLNKLERWNRELLGTYGQGEGGLGGDTEPVAAHRDRPGGPSRDLVASYQRVIDGGD